MSLFTIHSVEDHAQAQADYMPPGKLWRAKNILDSKIRALLRGYGISAKRQEEALDAFWEEVFIGTTVEYIGDFERAVGIPDDCFDGQGTLEERRLHVIVKLTSLGINTREEFEALAATLGFDDVNVLPGLAGGDNVILNGKFEGDFDWDKGVEWDISGGAANKTPGTSSSLSQEVTIFTDEFAFVRYEVLNRTAGTITPMVGTQSGTAQSTNDSFEEFISIGVEGVQLFPLPFPQTFGVPTTTIAFEADATFDGSIDEVSVNGSILPVSTARFTLVVEFPGEGNVDVFPLPFPIIFGNRVFTILACIYGELKPANCELLIKNIFAPTIESFLLGWGANTDGQLGLDDFDQRVFPAEVLPSFDWVTVSSSSLTTYVIKNNLAIWAWGDNTFGQLGQGDFDPSDVPIQMGEFIDWAVIAPGASHMLSIKTDGTLWGVGRNIEGELGLDDTTSRDVQVQVGTDTDWSSAAGGALFSFALKTDGTLFATGDNTSGQLAQGTTGGVLDEFTQESLGDSDWAFVTAGDDFTIAIKTDGTLFSCGNNADGQLGQNVTGGVVNTFTQESLAASDWFLASAGENFSVALKTDGTLHSCGNNDDGQLGQGNVTPLDEFTQIGIDTDWVAVSCGDRHVLALKSDGSLFAWGNNDEGQLGNGSTGTDVLSPVQLTVDADWKVIGAGSEYSMAISDIPFVSLVELFGTGTNLNGQLGLGNTTHPILNFTQEVSGDTEWASVAGEGQFSVAIKIDGTLWSAGQNTNGQLAQNDTAGPLDEFTQEFAEDMDWASVNTGVDFAIAIKTDGTMWSVGDNTEGQLGHGVTGGPDLLVYTKIGLDADWAAVGCGDDHVAALKMDGTLYTWGENSDGQLGLGFSGSPVNVPTQVGSDTWLSATGFSDSTVGVKTTKALFTWGNNADDQLGFAGPSDVDTPTQVGVDLDWIEGTGGNNFICVLKGNGTLWVSGANTFGQLGQGDTSPFSVLTQMNLETDWGSPSANGQSCFALKTDSTIYSWGFNNTGQLGQGDQTVKLVPTQVGSLTGYVDIGFAGGHCIVLKR